MKTAKEIFKQTLEELGFANYKPSEMTNSDYWLCTCRAMKAYHAQFTPPNEGEEEAKLSDKYKLLIYVVRSCLEDIKAELVITGETTVDNFRENEENDKQCKLICEYILNNFKYELSWNQMANGINLFLAGRSSNVKPEMTDEEIDKEFPLISPIQQIDTMHNKEMEGKRFGAKWYRNWLRSQINK